ncbi:TIR-like protein FxsC [Micromonospora rifamycinica]|uniref:TIR-like protein FxsC n=1 Tax=Micromonospora rifamycinica TaxID=291594 RepID=UPI002E297ED9|nr:TIR-like protein FxsC [Micromonospora rifamycinica]
MSWPDVAPAGVAGQETYFFLSYAHSVPLSDAARPDTDYWVGQFFHDLVEAVRGHPRRAAEIEAGFFDGQVSPGVDLRRMLTDALSLAHVFVPLYSPNYFRNAWALGERESFRSRLVRLSAARAQRHVLPVLWMPLPSWEDRPETVQALELVGDPDDRADYADNGLRALCKLSAYRAQYRSLLGALADRIVTVAEHAPLAPSRAAALTSGPVPDGPGTALVVTTLAADRARWRPYGDQHQLAVADYVAATAERLGLPTRVVELAEARDRASRSPAVVLVDAGVGVDAARAALDGLPPWVVPLVIAADHARGETTPEAIAGSLQDARFPRVLPVRTIDEFERCAPLLVTEARKQFLRHGPVDPPEGPHDPKPSLGPAGPFDVRRGKAER